MILLLLCPIGGFAEEGLDAIVGRLSSVTTFAFGGVGFAGTTSKGEIDFNFVLSQSAPIAMIAFEKLYLNGNAQAKAYALAGMKRLDTGRYNALLEHANVSTDDVATMMGCIVTRKHLNKVAGEIDRGEFPYGLVPER